MTGLSGRSREHIADGRLRIWLPAAAVVAVMVVTVPTALLMGSTVGQVLFFGVSALALGLCALSSPIFATILLIVTLFLWRIAVGGDQVIKFVFVALVIATALWLDRTPARLRGIGTVEWAMALYLMWNVYSMLAPHQYTADETSQSIAPSVPAFITTGTVIPFVLYVVGRYTFDRTAAVRLLLWTILMLAAYSAAVSILQFTGPTDWIWPRYIVDGADWPGRAAGVFNQPVVNGLLLALGLAIALLLLTRSSEPAWRRWLTFVIAIGCGYGIYLTHTRAVWLSSVVVLIIGAVMARGFRTGFVAALSITAAIVAINWSVFTSGDRTAGGVASAGEVEDRLNTIQTSLWAAAQKPIAGWGIGRFSAVNTYHHQLWAPEISWIRGYGIPSHQNELGILVELGLIGLAFWIAVLALVAYRMWDAYRTLPDDDLCGKPLAVTAIMAFAALFCSGLTVDLRFFNFPTAVVFLLVGISIGWSDRHKRAQAAAGGVIAEPVSHQHG